MILTHYALPSRVEDSVKVLFELKGHVFIELVFVLAHHMFYCHLDHVCVISITLAHLHILYLNFFVCHFNYYS